MAQAVLGEVEPGARKPPGAARHVRRCHAIEADDDAARAAVIGFRDRLLAHYLTVDAASFGAVARTEGLRAAVEALDRGPTRRLQPLDTGSPTPLEVVVSRWSLGDPIAPADAWRPWARPAALRAQRDRLAAALLESTSKSMISGR